MEADRPTRGRGGWLTAAAMLAVLTLSMLVSGGDGAATVIMFALLIVLVASVTAWALLRTRRQRREYEARLTAWAGERAAQAERLRIARDLHDLVSHGLGLVTVRAAAGRAAGAGAEPIAALTDIERVSRATTTELRRMLTVLRAPGAGPAPLRPAESLRDLPAIVGSARDAGLEVELDVGDLGEVSPGAQLTVCAVVREALNNTLRHAGPTRAGVRVRREDGLLVTTVRDDGPAGAWEARPGAGQGLAGLRERAAALGGTVHAAPSGHGYVVTAHLPGEPFA